MTRQDARRGALLSCNAYHLRKHHRAQPARDEGPRANLPTSRAARAHRDPGADQIARGGVARVGPSGRRARASIGRDRLRDRRRRDAVDAARHRSPARGDRALPRAAAHPHAPFQRAADARRSRRSGAAAARPRGGDPAFARGRGADDSLRVQHAGRGAIEPAALAPRAAVARGRGDAAFGRRLAPVSPDRPAALRSLRGELR